MQNRTKYVTLSASGQVLAGEGWLTGYSVTSGIGTLLLYDYTVATGAVHVAYDTRSFTGATDVDLQNTHFTRGCYAAIGPLVGSIVVTFRTLES